MKNFWRTPSSLRNTDINSYIIVKRLQYLLLYQQTFLFIQNLLYDAALLARRKPGALFQPSDELDHIIVLLNGYNVLSAEPPLILQEHGPVGLNLISIQELSILTIQGRPPELSSCTRKLSLDFSQFFKLPGLLLTA